MKKLMCLFLSAVLVLSGCGNSGGDSNTPGNTTSEITVAVEADYADYFNDLADAFNAENEDYKVVIVESGMFDVLDALPTQQGNSADIFMMPNDRIGDLANQKLITPLTFKPSGYTNAAIGAGTYNGDLYFVPMSTDTTLLLFNADDVTEVPETLAEIDPANFAAKFTDFYFTAGMFYTMGGYIFGNSTSDIGLNNEGAILAGEALKELYASGEDHWTLMQDDTVSYDIMQNALINGEVDFIINGPWAISDLENAGVNVGAAPIPTWDGTETYQALSGVKGLGINGYSKNIDGAQLFLEFIATAEYATKWHNETSEVSPHTAVVYEEGSVAETVFLATEAGAPMPTDAAFGKVWEPMADALKQIATGEDVKASLDAAVTRIEQEIASMR